MHSMCVFGTGACPVANDIFVVVVPGYPSRQITNTERSDARVNYMNCKNTLCDFTEFPTEDLRRISTPPLNTLLCLYVEPINLIIS